MQTTLSLMKAPRLSLNPLDADVTLIDAPGGTSDVDVSLNLAERDDMIEGWLQYNATRCGRADARRLADTFAYVARASAADERFPLGQLAAIG